MSIYNSTKKYNKIAKKYLTITSIFWNNTNIRIFEILLMTTRFKNGDFLSIAEYAYTYIPYKNLLDR